MRILFDALSLDSRSSGTRSRLFGLLAALSPRADLEISALHGPRLPEEERALLPGVRWLEVPKPPVGAALRAMRQGPVYRLIGQAAAADAVIADCVPFPSGVALVPTIHDLRHVKLTGIRGRLYRGALRRGLDRARVVHVVSQAVRDELVRFHPLVEERLVVVPNGVDTRHFHAREEVADAAVLEGLGIAPPYLLWVGHLEPRKDPQAALDVRVQLAERGLDLPIIFVGRGPCLPEEGLCWLESVRPDQRAGQVLRAVPTRDLPALYRHASLTLATSRLEGFGIVPLEAAACGCPVVATDIPAHVEVLGPGALYAPPGDLGALVSAALSVIYNLEDVAGLKARAAERVGLYTWENAAEAFVNSLTA